MNSFSPRFESPEGATPITDYSGLKPKWVHTMKDLNRVEAENIMEAQQKWLRHPVSTPENWFTTKELRKIHQAMFGSVWEWAGNYRESHTSIGIQPGHIPFQLPHFCNEVQSWSQHAVELTFLEMAARVHHRLVSIHPFENGNGRFSRLVSDRVLLSWRCPYPIWPSQLGENCVERKKYIQSLKHADEGNYTPLIDLMKSLGAQDPSIGELLSNKFFLKSLNRDRLLAVMRALLRNGGDPNKETLKGHRPLQLAVKTKMEEAVKLLLDTGADVDAPDQSRLTPFQVAVMQQNKTIADLLASRGAKRQLSPGLGYAAYYSVYHEPPSAQ